MSAERIKKFGEVFTPPELVKEILKKIPRKIWKDLSKKWLDPTCGDGVFLIEVKEKLMRTNKNSKKFKSSTELEDHILNNMIYGVDIQEDNCIECIKRLYNPDNIKPISLREAKKRDDGKNYKGRDGIKKLFLIKKGNKEKLIRNIICADGLIYQYNFGEEEDTIDGKGQYKIF